METVLRTHSLSYAESVRLALESEGIEAAVLDQYTALALAAAGGIRVAVMVDADADRARQIIAKLAPPRVEMPPSWPWHKRAFLAFVGGFALLFLRYVLADLTGWDMARHTLGAASLVLFVAAIALFRRGTRADHADSNETARH